MSRIARAHSIAASVDDDSWPNTIPAGRPAMVIADGLFAFLSESVIVGVFRRITEHFASGELAFNDYGRIGWISRLAVRSDRMSAPEITDYIERNIIDRLTTLDGVASVTIFGSRRHAIRVWLNRRDLAARNLTVADIEAALKRLSPGPLHYVINTHWHGDHTGGNEYFGQQAAIVAHENVRRRLSDGRAGVLARGDGRVTARRRSKGQGAQGRRVRGRNIRLQKGVR